MKASTQKKFTVGLAILVIIGLLVGILLPFAASFNY